MEGGTVRLVGHGHPLARKGLAADQYLRAAHAVPMPYTVAHRGVVETHLASIDLSRNATVVMPCFYMALHLLPATDLFSTTSRQFARLLPLVILPAPFDFPRMRFYRLWHERPHLTQRKHGLRQLLSAVTRRQLGETAGSLAARPWHRRPIRR